MTMRRPCKVLIGLFASTILIQGIFGGLFPAGAAEGDLTRVGGNPTGCPTLEQMQADFQRPAEKRFKPLALSGGVFTESRGIQAIASNPLVGGPGGLYLLSGEQILGSTSIIAESLTVGDDEVLAKSFITEGIAAYGNSLWVVQSKQNTSTVPGATLLPGRVRRVDLDTQTVATVAPTNGPNPTAIAADSAGNLYVTEDNQANDAVYMIGSAGPIALPSVADPTGIAVDVLGAEVFVAGSEGVHRLVGTSKQLIAGPGITHSDGTPQVAAPTAVAVGHEIVEGQAPRARYVYIADGGRVVRVDLKGTSPTITTVAGGGPETVTSGPVRARNAKLSARSITLAADIAAHVYIADPDQCAVYQLDTPSPVALNTVVTNPSALTNTTVPTGGGRTGDNESTAPAPDPAPAGNGNTQLDTATGGQPAGQGSQTQIVPGSQTQVQPPQTELRVIDQGNVVTAPQQAAQPSVEPVPTPAPAPTPAPTPTPADVSTAVAPDPGPSSAAVADAGPAVPPAPAAAPVPPAPASAPPPAAQQPVSNVGLAHGDSAAPTRGATRYAMVRNDEEQSVVAALAMAGAGVMVAVFLCVMFVAPGASSKPKPRPKGAY